MLTQTIYVPVPVSEDVELPEEGRPHTWITMEGTHFYGYLSGDYVTMFDDSYKLTYLTHWLKPQSDMICMSREELKKMMIDFANQCRCNSELIPFELPDFLKEIEV